MLGKAVMRDIEKDKAMCESATIAPWKRSKYRDGVLLTEYRQALPYWIRQYEAVAADLDKYHKLHDEAYNEHRILLTQYEAAQARISELEGELQFLTRTNHDRLLQKIWEGLD